MTKETPRNPETKEYHAPRWWEIRELESNGCRCQDWSRVLLSSDTDLRLLRNVTFAGSNEIGPLDSGRTPGAMIENALLEDCVTGADVTIRNVSGRLRGLSIGPRAVIENIGRYEKDAESACGVGTRVSVLDETGSRPVLIYPGMTAQTAMIMARMPRLSEEEIIPRISEAIINSQRPLHTVGAGSVVRDCGILKNVRIWPGVKVEGARNLVNGSIVNNVESTDRELAYVGSGVDAENFIIEDGRVDSGAILRNVYVGQGAVIEKGFTAHDSVFLANCSMENGEACAVLAGPYSVSMHKSTLLIGCQTSFMNAGSATNQSNHMYKLGPVHWGVLQRGVKTSSNSYLMLGAKIGAFSLLMGDHKTHPDSSEFPFSYLFGDEKGSTVVVPAMMLRSCGLMRDEKKWPTRDRRLKRRMPIHDRIVFDVLNPHTVSHILRALETIGELLDRPADDDRYVRYKGMKFSRASLERARNIYTLSIFKYLDMRLGERPIPEKEDPDKTPDRWVDMLGLIIPDKLAKEAMEAETLEEMERRFDEAFANYRELELRWIGDTFGDWWRERRDRFHLEAERFDEMVDDDRNSYKEDLRRENGMLALL